MREIKFRAWNEVEEKMLNWNEFLDTNMKNTFIAPESTGLILMQYTGLKDKNEKEIYEGDIVKSKLYTSNYGKYFIGKVEYCGSSFIVDINNDSDYHIYDLDDFGENYRNNLEDLEVIGNMYENPELLEKGE